MKKKTLRQPDLFLHEVSNLSTALTFVADELNTVTHTDPTVNELIGGLTILTGRLHRTVKEKIISKTGATMWRKKTPRKKQTRRVK